MHAQRSSVAVLLLLAATGCQVDQQLTSPELGAARAAVSSAAVAGAPGFHFLAPIGDKVSYGGTFDGTLQPVVEICRWQGESCDMPLVARFSMTEGQGASRLRMSLEDEHYSVVWDTRTPAVVVGGSYRIRVVVGGVELGAVNVGVVASARDAGSTPGTVYVVHRQSLPIRFRIERDEVFPTDSEGGVVVTRDGTVALDFPAGALTDETVITVRPSTAAAPDPDMVPGTMFDFGPDGTQFAVPVTLSIRYDPALLPPGILESQLRIKKLVDGRWQVVSPSSVDPSTRTVSGPISSFSEWGIGVAGLELGSISAGETHTCGLDADGRAYCWGSNDSGQLGDGTNTDRLLPTPVAGSLRFTALTAGGLNTCGLTTGGQVHCWGGNQMGQLGNGTTTGSSSPVLVDGGPFTSVDLGYRMACGLTAAGKVHCWGWNQNFQLGTTTTEQCELNPGQWLACSTRPVAVDQVVDFQTVSVGFWSACGLTAAGEAHCWGNNGFRHLDPTTSLPVRAPTHVAQGMLFRSITSGTIFTCGIALDGRSYCWGNNTNGQLGDGTAINRDAPALIAGGPLFDRIFASQENTVFGWACGIEGGALSCWGSNDSGQLGSSAPMQTCTSYGQSVTCSPSPVPVNSSASFTAVVAGMSHTCGLSSTGDVYCWGRNARGQLGNGSTTDASVPIRVTR